MRDWLLLSTLVLVVALGCGGDKKTDTSAKNVAGTTAQALTDGLSFAGGIVKAGGIPAASAEKVTLDPGSSTLELTPSESTLLPLEITNPDEDTDPIEATLLQFGDDQNHVEIPRASSESVSVSLDGGGSSSSANGVVHLDVQIGVGTNICKDLCQGRIEVKMLLAALLSSGRVGQHAMRDVELNCSTAGDPDKCGSSASGAPAMPVCDSGKKRCTGNGVQSCAEGKWGEVADCTDQTCVAGVCKGECAPTAKQCDGLLPLTCGADGSWQQGTECKGKCSKGVCVAVPDASVKAEAPDASLKADAGVQPDAAVTPDAGVAPHPDAGSTDAGPTCIGGGSCSYAANACHEGVYACDENHAQVCQDNGPKTNGASCGADHVCFGGSCVACKVGDVCDALNPCAIGTYDSCTNGPHCAAQHAAPDGMACGTLPDHVCSGGNCIACQQGATCTPANECHNGITDCSAGVVCNDQQTNASDGAACTANGGRYCQAGVCVPCHAGDPCTLTGNACRTGQITCGVSGPACAGTGAVAQDGSDCGSGRVCISGSCVTTSWTLSVSSGDAQTKRVDEALGPITLSVKDQSGTAVPNVAIQIAVPPGAYAPATAVTNSSGVATVVPRLGRATGSYTFTATSSAAPAVTFHATAIAPSPKTLFNVVSQSHASGADGIGGPATMAHVSYAYSVTAASDGTLYFGDNCSVFAITPAGVITRVAGTGGCGSSGGDIGAATSIQLYYPNDLALDETNGFLYISDNANQKVRQVDLATGTMQTYAGGGTTTATDYGDNQLATLAVLSNVTSLSVDSAGNLYIGDSGHYRLRKVDTAQVITTFKVGSSTCPAGLALYSCSGSCSVTWDSSGQAFIAGQFCGSATANNAVYGIARLEQDGSFSLVAGSSSSSTGDNIQATAAYLSGLLHIAFDPAGNLYVAGDNESRIRRIDTATGIITTVAGDGTAGYKGDYVDGLSGTAAEFYNIKDIAFDSAGNLYIADYQNFTLRAIAAQGEATPNSVSMAISAGNNQSAKIDALFSPPLAVTLTDGQNQPIAGASVAWQALDAGSGLMGASSATTLSGIASIGGRPGLAVGPYHFTARYRDIHGQDAAGSPANFVVNATAPNTGDVFTIVNTDHTSGTTAQTTPGTFAHTSYATGLATGSDGTLYIGEYCQVSTLSPEGVFKPLAGNGSCSFGGDGGRALDARLYDIEGLLLDETNPANRLLYINDHANTKIRVVRLDANPPTIDTVVGYVGGGTAPGSPNYGVPGPGTGVALGSVYGMALNPVDHDLYLVEAGHNRILQVDAAGNVASWLAPNSSCTGAINFYSMNGYSQIAFTSGGIAYITGNVCGTSTNGSAVLGVVQRAVNGTLTWIAGQSSSTGNTNDGTLATSTYFPSFGPMLLDPSGTSLYVSVYGSNIVRKISGLDGNGTVTTIAGNGTNTYSGDYVPATSAQFYQPWSMTLTPAGHLVVSDYYNYAFREIW